MFRVIKIGEKEVEMVANAATTYRYKQIFRRDYYREINAKERDTFDNIDIFTRMGFVMAKQAEKADMAKLSEEDFFEWLEQFDPLAVSMAVDQISLLANGSKEGTVDPKKEAAQ